MRIQHGLTFDEVAASGKVGIKRGNFPRRTPGSTGSSVFSTARVLRKVRGLCQPRYPN